MSAANGERDAWPEGTSPGPPAGPRGLGWWMLPLFVAVGLAGAVLATALVVVSQNQRIEALRDETAAARSDLADAVEEVESVAEEALDAIRSEVESVRDELATELPLEDAAEQGVVHLRAEVPAAPEAAPASLRRSAAPQPDAPEDGSTEDGDGATDEQDDPQEDDGPADGGQAEADDAGREPAPPPPPEARQATGFVVAREGEATFLVTTYGLLADPTGGDRPVDRPVEVRSSAGGATARVHSWDADADLLLLRIGGGPFEPLEWRPEDRPVRPGDRITAVGVTPSLAAVRVGGAVGASTSSGLVTDVPPLELLAGGPVVDADGRVVAMSSRRATPFGDDPVAVPIRVLCGELLAACPD